jgi:hypothetical protein
LASVFQLPSFLFPSGLTGAGQLVGDRVRQRERARGRKRAREREIERKRDRERERKKEIERERERERERVRERREKPPAITHGVRYGRGCPPLPSVVILLSGPSNNFVIFF